MAGKKSQRKNEIRVREVSSEHCAGIMLAQRRRRWLNVQTTQSQCVVFAGSLVFKSHQNTVDLFSNYFCKMLPTCYTRSGLPQAHMSVYSKYAMCLLGVQLVKVTQNKILLTISGIGLACWLQYLWFGENVHFQQTHAIETMLVYLMLAKHRRRWTNVFSMWCVCWVISLLIDTANVVCWDLGISWEMSMGI